MNYEIVNALGLIEDLACKARMSIASTEEASKLAEHPPLAMPGKRVPPNAAQFQQQAGQQATMANQAIRAMLSVSKRVDALMRGGGEGPDGPPDPETDPSPATELVSRNGMAMGDD